MSGVLLLAVELLSYLNITKNAYRSNVQAELLNVLTLKIERIISMMGNLRSDSKTPKLGISLLH